MGDTVGVASSLCCLYLPTAQQLHITMLWNFSAEDSVCSPVHNFHVSQMGDAGPWVFALFIFTPPPSRVTQCDQLRLCDDFD